MSATSDFPTVCAIDDAGERVVIAVREGRRRNVLLVHRLQDGAELARLDEFREPYQGSNGYHVILRGDLLIGHTRPSTAASGGAYRLRVNELPGLRELGRYGAYVASRTARFHLCRDGQRLFNVTGGYRLQEIDLETHSVQDLCNVRKELFGHFLELTASPDERLLVVWAAVRSTLVLWDRKLGTRYDLLLGPAAEVLGFDARGRHLLLKNGPGSVVSVETAWVLEAETEPERIPAGPLREHLLLKGPWAFAELDPTGRTLVVGKRGKDGWELELHRVVSGS